MLLSERTEAVAEEVDMRRKRRLLKPLNNAQKVRVMLTTKTLTKPVGYMPSAEWRLLWARPILVQLKEERRWWGLTY